ncbi:uridine monophosphate kinase [Candidatus Saccharibacteria bacterium]|nr:uridine monophosphate kinase [Candidatus Saccharibacteria bacterium]
MSNQLSYKRVLLKLSGEQLGRVAIDPETGNEIQVGFDAERARWIAGEVKKLIDQQIQIVITVGGGNFVRGADVTCDLISPTEGDEAGILATVLNATLLGNVFAHSGIPVRATSKIDIPAFIDRYTYRRTIHDLEQKGRVVIIGGGSGQTGFTSDMGALNAATTLGCDLVIKATKVDGVYDSDPVKNPSAMKFASLDYHTAITDPAIRVMDKAALGMAAEHNIPIIVLELTKENNILNAALGKSIGTIVQ